jgi:hypothetical protein
VRVEVEAALARGVRVIPLLVGGAEMPQRQDLPTVLGSWRTATRWRCAMTASVLTLRG